MINIRNATINDAAACAEIYNYYIENTTVTFEEVPLSPEAFVSRISRITETYPFLVAEGNGKILGYAYLDKFNERSAYRFTADFSIYLSYKQVRRGIGALLLSEIEKIAKETGLKNIISIITEENAASVTFHEKHGFILVGELNGVGLKFDKTLSVKYYQKTL